MLDYDAILGTLLGFITGALLLSLFFLVVSPNGDKTVTQQCLQENPNVCRTITTYTDVYKEIK